MAINQVLVTVVDIGQGQCTFVELIDDGAPTKPKYVLLFDCGSDKNSVNVNTNLDYMIERIKLMDDPAIDCIIFSHSDKDHINETIWLLGKFYPLKPKVREVCFGGMREKYTKYGFNIIDYIEQEKYCASDKIFGLPSNTSDYDNTTGKYKNEQIWKTPDGVVTVYAIGANVISNDPDFDENDDDWFFGSKAEEYNRVSIVAGLYFKGSTSTTSFVICGDATNATFQALNGHFKNTTVFKNNMMTTLPHHGSRATGFAVTSAQTVSKASRAVVQTFANILNSNQLTVSAFEKHRHPSLELINAFLPMLKKPLIKDPRLMQDDSHRLSAYLDITLKAPKGVTLPRDESCSFDTPSGTFSTKYTTPVTRFGYTLGNERVTKGLGTNKKMKGNGGKVDVALNEHACWQYKALTDGTAPLGGYPNLKLPLALFTEGTTADAIQPDADHIALWEQEPLKSILAERKKYRERPAEMQVRRPAQNPSTFKTRLKQFH